MKIFVFSTHAHWQPHLETELEIIQNHLNKGDEVYRFVCNGDLPACDVNNNHDLTICIQCKGMSMYGKTLLDGAITDLPLIHTNPLLKKKVASASFSYNSIEELKAIHIDNFDIGMSVSSSIISWKREPELDIQKYKELINSGLYSAASVYYSALMYIQELKPDLIYVFNGRLIHVKPLMRAAAVTGVECEIHERGHDKNHYQVFKNTTPHDRNYVLKKMLEMWESADPEKKVAIGESFYTERVAGKEQGWHSFTNSQQKGLLPADWDEKKRNVVIFNSSEDEFASIGPDWKNELYTVTQLDAINRIIVDCQKFSDIHFYLRVHPNLINVVNSETNAIRKLSYPNLTVIEAESPISTYDLLFNAEKILAFGSSVGIEAVYWKKPSIQAGKSFYFDLNATYKPKTHEELVQMIEAKLEPLPQTAALIYGYYFRTFGIPFKYYSAKNLNTGSFKNVNIYEEVLASRMLYKVLKRNPVFKLPTTLLERYFKKYKKRIPGFLLKKL